MVLSQPAAPVRRPQPVLAAPGIPHSPPAPGSGAGIGPPLPGPFLQPEPGQLPFLMIHVLILGLT